MSTPKSTTGMLSPVAAVKAALQAYVDKDRAAIEAVIGDPYTFTSPLDNALNRQTYFSRCWPNSKNMTTIQVIQAFEADDRACVVYDPAQLQSDFAMQSFTRCVTGALWRPRCTLVGTCRTKQHPGNSSRTEHVI